MTTITGSPTVEPKTATSFSKAVRHPSQVLTWVLLIFSLAGVLLFASEVRIFLQSPGDNVFPESAAVVSVQKWLQGEALYTDYRQPPYSVTAFPPVWYGLLASGPRLGFEGVDGLTTFGRLLTVLGLLGIASLVFFSGRLLGYSTRFAALGAGLYLSFPILVPWAIAVRPDTVAQLLSFAGLLIVLRSTSLGSIAIAALFMASAFLTRHNMVAVPGCVGLWLLSMKRWKELAVLTAVWMAVVASGFAIAQSVTDGLLAVNLSGAKFGKLALVYSRDSLLRLLTVIPGSGFVVVLFSLGGIGTYLGFTEPDRRYRLLSLYVLTSLGAAIIGSSAAGGDVNHYLESALVFSLLAPYCASRIEQEADGKPTLLWFAGALVALLMGTGLYTERPAVLRAQRQDLSEVRRLVEHRRVFSDVPYLAARSSTPEALDAASLTYAARTGSWSGATIVSSLSRQEYELVALSAPVDSLVDTGLAFPRYPHLSPAIGAAIRENYRLCSTVDGVLIYRPFSGDNVGCP